MLKNNNKNGFSLIELGICLLIIAVLVAMTPDPLHPKTSYIERRDCFSNQRLIQGAIEMYNMDVSDMVDTVIPGRDYESFEDLLLREGYFKEPLPLSSPECSYGFVNITDNGSVFCKKHGTIESKDSKNPIIPKYDKSQEKPLTDTYYTSKEKVNKKREYQIMLENFKRPNNLITIILVSLSVISLITGFVQYFSAIKVKRGKNESTE